MLLSNELIEMVRQKTECDLSIEEIENAYGPAKRKLDDLINRFGTDNGQRLKPRYLAQLIFEQINCSRIAKRCCIQYELNMLDKKEEQPA